MNSAKNSCVGNAHLSGATFGLLRFMEWLVGWKIFSCLDGNLAFSDFGVVGFSVQVTFL